ncbi:MAG: DNA-formamidopyrimidine glycosylase family protein, partial [Jatrophihabitans sp.]
MPEGHTLHRLAREHQRVFGGGIVRASSPQGRFTDGAARIDGQSLVRTEAHGKHLLHHYGNEAILHIHLGLYGKFTAGKGEPPEPRGALRLRLSTEYAWTDLRGPTACELLTPEQVDALAARLGPDPLRGDA